MSVSVSPLIIEQFKGIREYNGVNSNGQISALDTYNVELVQTEIGANVGIKTMKGNTLAYILPDGFSIIEIFKSVQEGVSYKFIYAENEQKGVLYYVNIENNLEIVIDNLSVTGKANGITMTSTAYDVFVFTNGVEAKTVSFTSDAAYGDRVKTINAIDNFNREIHWLAMTEWNGYLVVASEYGVHASHQNDIYIWNDNPEGIADSWHIDFSKKVTAVYSYTRGLYIFTGDDTSYINTTPNDAENASMEMIAGVGCFDYKSIVKHDTYLYFYDNNQKNVYYIQNIDSGQTRPAGPIAKEIQSYFNEVKRFKMYSCIYGNRNEIWCILNDDILICDYAQGEWTKRNEQSVNTVSMIENIVYTGTSNGEILIENINDDFNGAFYPALYQTTFINMGSDSNIKKQKTPLLIVLKKDEVQDFWVQLIVNNKPKNPKRISIQKDGARYVSEDAEDGARYGQARYAITNPYAIQVIEISTPQTWYTLGIKIFTDSPRQGFYINSMELKNVKEKTKTRGR